LPGASAAGDTELADGTAGSLSASVYCSSPVTAGTHLGSATATTASIKAVTSLLALKP